MGCLAVRGELLSFSLFPSSIFRWRGDFTSLLPRPNPLITGPERRMGNGVSGPESGPETGGRGVEDGISFFLFSFFFSSPGCSELVVEEGGVSMIILKWCVSIRK